MQDLTLSQAVQALDPVYLICRDMGHNFADGLSAVSKDGTVYVEHSVCPRCTTAVRTRKISSEGYLLSTRITYEKDYLLKGFGQLTRDDRAVVRALRLKNDLARFNVTPIRRSRRKSS